MASPMYPETSWVDPRLEKRSSSIHGTGVFANQFIQAGERLVIAGGIVFTSEDWQAGNVQLDPAKQYNEAQIGENLFLAMPIDEDINYWFNHSCDPNFWGDVARRDIQAGAEITTDWALWTKIIAWNHANVGLCCADAKSRGMIGNCSSCRIATVGSLEHISNAGYSNSTRTSS